MKKLIVLGIFAFILISKSTCQEEKYIGLFVYNFAKYFEWPESSISESFTIQIIGHKSVYDELTRLTAGKKVGVHNIKVENISNPEQIKDNAQIVFLGHWQTRHIDAIREKLANKPTLLVTEFEGLLEKGSVINFVIREGTIKFELHKGNANATGLHTDPRLLQLAYSVTE